MLRIDRENDRPRKDIAHYSEVKELFSYIFNEYYNPKSSLIYDAKLKKRRYYKIFKKNIF